MYGDNLSSSSVTTSNKTHYETLGVEETAKYSTIKNAHRKLALRYHPDKLLAVAAARSDKSAKSASVDATKSASSSKVSTDNLDDEDAFKKIQTAWECLCDDKKRKEYDDTLSRMRERNHGNTMKAQSVKLAEMDCEVCDVEDDEESDDDIGGDRNDDGLQMQKLYTYKCRCGDVFEILEEELLFDDTQTNENIFQCGSCSLFINIIP